MSGQINPLEVKTGGQPVPPPLALPGGDGTAALWWTVTIALAPLVCEMAITVVIGARPLSSIGLFHVGLSVFGLTLAALVRILSHGRGANFVPILFVIALLEVILALYFGGTFSQHHVEASHIESDIAMIERVPHQGQSIAPVKISTLERIREDLTAIQDSKPESSIEGYILMAAFGIFSFFILIRYWSGPTASERLQASKEVRG